MQIKNLFKKFINIEKAWKKQLLVLSFLAGLLVLFCLVIWFHPKMGYAQSGIIKGADLRSDIIQVFWIIFTMFSMVTTLILIIYEKLTQGAPLLIWIIAYSLAIYLAKAIMPIIDWYY